MRSQEYDGDKRQHKRKEEDTAHRATPFGRLVPETLDGIAALKTVSAPAREAIRLASGDPALEAANAILYCDTRRMTGSALST